MPKTATEQPKTKAKAKKPAKPTNPWKSASEEYARKYRPLTLGGVIGQDGAKSMIRGFAKKRMLPGAILFHGSHGNGKTTMARIVAAIANCQDLQEDATPCGECRSCKLMRTKHPDYVEINGVAYGGVDDVRALLQRAAYRPAFNKLVIVIDEAHELTPKAMEALLKDAEEPQSHVMWIFATTDMQKLKATLLSRFAKIAVTELPRESTMKLMRKVCKAEGVKVSDEILELVCNRAGAHVRDCLKLLEMITSALDGGALDAKKVDESSVEKYVSSILSIPNYEHVQAFLANVYAGELHHAMKFASLTPVPKPMFLKSCIEVHGNVMLAMASKRPSDCINDGYVLRYVDKISKIGKLKSTPTTADLLQRMAGDMIDLFTKTGQFQLGDSIAGLAMLATRYTIRFRDNQNNRGK